MQRTIQKGRTSTAFRYPIYGQVGGSYGGSNSSMWSEIGNGRLLPGGDFDYLREAGDLWKNAVVGAILNFLMRCMVEPQLHVLAKVGTEEAEVAGHPLIALFDTPNEDDDDTNTLVAAYTMDWNIWGNCYYYLLRSGAGKVTGIQHLPRRLVRPVPDMTGRTRVSGYAYWIDGKPILFGKDDVVQHRFGIDPDNPREGLSPLLASCRDICGENSLATLGAAIARNHGIPGYLIQPADPIPGISGGADEEAFNVSYLKKFQRFWTQKFGRDRAAEPLVSTARMKIDRLGFSPDELMADKSREIAVSRICAAMGIDPMVIGLPSSSKTYSNLGEAHRAAYDHNIVPNGDSFCSKFTRKFRKEVGYLKANERLAWDYSNVGAMQDDFDALYKRLSLVVGGPFLANNEARRIAGFEEMDGEDKIRVAAVKAPSPVSDGNSEAGE
jgi:phage portal protein BeeE